MFRILLLSFFFLISSSISYAHSLSINDDGSVSFNDSSFPSILDFALSNNPMFHSKPDKCKGIQCRRAFFVDSYNFDFYPESISSFSISLPYSVDSHNADSISDDDKSLTWLNPNRNIQVRFKIWHFDRIVWFAVMTLFVLIFSIGVYFKSKELSNPDIRDPHIRSAKFFASLSILVIIISSFLIFFPVSFDDDDIISPTIISSNE